MQDSNIARLDGKGIVGNRQFKQLVQNWGKLPEKQRTEALANLTRGMPARHREIIENYLKKIAQSSPSQP
jgi:hypothetical protein